jgi:hypothetical protein
MAGAINHGKVYSESRRQANVVIRLLLLAFLIVCVFDPADRFGAKVWLFTALWGATVMTKLLQPDGTYLPAGLLFYVSLFIAIPLLSIFWYYLSNGTQPYEGFALVKGYLFVSLAIVLTINRIDAAPLLSAILTVLAILTIAISITLQLWPDLFLTLYNFSNESGLLFLNNRTYAEGLTVTQVFFVTSSMLTISIAHYFDRGLSQPNIKMKLFYLALSAISTLGMLAVGLRNSIAVAVLLPFFLWPLYTRRIVRNALISLGVLALLLLPVVYELQGFLDPAELSNSIKLTFLEDYATIFSDPVTLLLGQGLGAYYNWSASGRLGLGGGEYYYITELTYLELLRNFGLFGAATMMALLLYPVAQAFLANTNRRPRALAVAFLAFLGMSATNPLLFSSLGMLVLSALLAVTFQEAEAGTG